MASSLRRRLGRRFLGFFLGLGARDVDVHEELVDALAALLCGLDLDQSWAFQVGRGLQVAHQRGHPCLRLGKSADRDPGAGLFDALQVYPVGQLPYQLVKQVDHFGAGTLQGFHHPLAREQRSSLVFQLLDLGDLLIEFFNLAQEVFVATHLIVELVFEIGVHAKPDGDADEDDDTQHDEELFLLLFAPDLAMRQKVDANHGSNLRMASPHATISDGASCVSDFARILEDSAMLTNGFATIVLTCTRFDTASSTPGIAAHPPESTM